MAKNLIDLTLFDSIDASEVLVLTPNLRLQRKFSKAYGMAQQEKGMSSWRSPQAYALDSWLTDQWCELQDQGYTPAASKVLVDQNQLHALWSLIISNDSTHQMDVINPSSLTAPAISAQRTMDMWDIENYDFLDGQTLETESFRRWQSEALMMIERRHWVTPEGRTKLIIKAIQDGHIPIPPQTVLFSFDEIPPLFESLFNAIQNIGAVITTIDSRATPDNLCKVPVKERADQYTLAARWAKAALELDENATVAIVCPELSDHRGEMEEAFARVFEPQYLLPQTPRYTLPFNFSAGVPLSGVPLIKDALDFLSLGKANASLSSISALLRSPYIGSSEAELVTRTKFDLKLKNGHSGTLNLDGLLQTGSCPAEFAKHIGNFLIHTVNAPHKQKPSQWAFHFGKALETLGWPGNRNLDSEEYQALTHWHDQLDLLSKLDLVHTECSRNKALSLLRQCIGRTVFQPETADSPIQILGILEAAGLNFDYVWVMDLNDDIWPQAPKPNPFIPISSQKSLGMPHSSGERELAFSKQILDRLISGGREVIMSYAEWDNDKELRYSSLIHEFKTVTMDGLPLASVDDYGQLLLGAAEFYPIQDGQIPIADLSEVKGGTGIFTAQAGCPFSSFAKYRLKSSEMPSISLGLNHLERGDLIHHTLEFLWKKLISQENLHNLSPEEQDLLVNEAIDFSVFWLKGKRKDLGDRLISIEKQRLYHVITEWLVVEKKRAPFIVSECESRIKTSVGGLPITVRRDRVDEIDGKRFHIDYKTGRAAISNWAGERPDAPQIPLYAITDDKPNTGVAFGLVRRGESSIKGISENGDVSAGVIPADALKVDLPHTWDAIKTQWKVSLESLAKEFIDGVATVSPKNKNTCVNCHLSTLCRI